MHKGLIAFIVVASIGFATMLIILMKHSAIEAKHKSDKILEDFKTVDRDLKKSAIVIDSANNNLIDSFTKK